MPGLSYKDDCPYCGTRHVVFTAAYAWRTKGEEKRAIFECGYCSEGVVREYDIPKRGSALIDLMQYTGDGTQWGLSVLKQWPTSPSSAAPPDCPANVSSFFRQAAESLHSNSFDAAGMMFRKTLEAATKALDSSLEKVNLAKRIKELVLRAILTPALGSWADEVRLGGNDAAHEEDPFTKEEADSLRHFTENFLHYAFTMPAAVLRRSAPALLDHSE